MDKTLKNSGKNVFGGRQGPPKPPFWPKRGVLAAPVAPPENIFFTNFQCFIDLFGLSAFQHAFTRYFTLTLSRFMMFFIKFVLLVENMGILFSENFPKRAFLSNAF